MRIRQFRNPQGFISSSIDATLLASRQITHDYVGVFVVVVVVVVVDVVVIAVVGVVLVGV